MQSVGNSPRIDPVRIIIPGNYYDCQIYRGRLYLWTINGAVQIYDWNKLLNTKVIPNFSIRLPFVFGFMEGNFLYDKKVSYIFSEKSYNFILLKQYNELLHAKVEILKDDLESSILQQIDLPFNELPTDTEVYANNIYYALDSGIYRRVINSGLSEKAISSKDTKLWDCRILSLRANKYPQIALSAGSDGLFELNLVKNSALKPQSVENIRDTKIFKISPKSSSFSNYSFLSIFSSSYVEDSFMAMFNWKPLDAVNKGDENHKVYREFDELISEEKIFGNNESSDICWGIDDKIYRIIGNKLHILKFINSPNISKGESYYKYLNSMELPSNIGRIIGAGASYFGIVLEFTKGVLILRSDGNVTTIPEEVIRWRIYPRSKNYLNHLHLIFNDRIEIYSFNHDALINQRTKRIGLEYIPDDIPFYRNRTSSIINEDEYPSDDSSFQQGNFNKFNIDEDDQLPF